MVQSPLELFLSASRGALSGAFSSLIADGTKYLVKHLVGRRDRHYCSDHTGAPARARKNNCERSRFDSARFQDQARAKGPVFSLTAEWEILPPSFGLITRFWHVNIRNASSRSKHVLAFRSIPLCSHQFVIKSRGGGSSSRQWKCVCDLYLLVLGCLRYFRCWNESPLCLFTILRLLKCKFRIMLGGFRRDVSVARITHSNRQETRDSTHQCETTHLRWDFKRRVPKHVNVYPRNRTPRRVRFIITDISLERRRL
jgi:hypothetical protein